jgi:nitronate monooxygenase
VDDLIVSSAVTGTDASWLRPSLVANGYDLENLSTPVRRSYNGGSDEGHTRWKDIWAAGQGLQTIHAVEPAATVVDRLETEYHRALARRVPLTGGA